MTTDQLHAIAAHKGLMTHCVLTRAFFEFPNRDTALSKIDPLDPDASKQQKDIMATAAPWVQLHRLAEQGVEVLERFEDESVDKIIGESRRLLRELLEKYETIPGCEKEVKGVRGLPVIEAWLEGGEIAEMVAISEWIIECCKE